jgi:hypothetical protein
MAGQSHLGFQAFGAHEAAMKRAPVSSSSIASVGYEAGLATLEVEFVGGAVYRYFAVPVAVHLELLGAASKGAFLNRFVRDVFPFARL